MAHKHYWQASLPKETDPVRAISLNTAMNLRSDEKTQPVSTGLFCRVSSLS